jgi:hypothetical protein
MLLFQAEVKPDARGKTRSDKGTTSRQSDPVGKVQKPTIAVPKLNKVTAFEFTQAWTSLKGTSDIEPYVKLLDQIQPADIPKGNFNIAFSHCKLLT